MAEYDPHIRTRTLARIVGPYMLAIGTALLARPAMFSDMFPAFMTDSALVFATAAFTLIAGLSMVAAHHHWSSAAACVISFTAIAVSLKGFWLMVAPDWGAELTQAVVDAPYALTAAAASELVIGAWLTVVGWFAKPAA